MMRLVLCFSYNTTPSSSGRSSPTNVDTQSTVSVSQGGWTTGNTTERSSLDSSCYSLDVSPPALFSLVVVVVSQVLPYSSGLSLAYNCPCSAFLLLRLVTS